MSSVKPKGKLPERKLPDFREYKISPRHEQAARNVGLENIPLVVKIAKGYSRVAEKLSLPLNNIVQAGIIGLMEAKKRYKEETGNTFATFAAPYIRGYILEYLKELKLYGGTEKHSSILDRALDLWERKNAGENIDKKLEKSEKHVQMAFKRIKSEDHADILRGRLRARRALAGHANFPDSLEKKTTKEDGEGYALHEVIPDKRESAPDVLDREQTKRRLITEVMKLPEKERFVVELRFLAEEPKTLEEIGKLLKLTRERVRQIEEKALGKLRKRLLRE